MSNTWYGSDWHLGHKNLMLRYRKPFQTIEEVYDSYLIEFYETVKPGDNIYFMGDLSLKLNWCEWFLKELPSNIFFHWILGNHDLKLLQAEKRFGKYCASISQIKEIKVNNQKITLCHYPMVSWNCSHYGAWMLHGHHHTDISNITQGKTLNVCIDVTGKLLLSFEEIQEKMEEKSNNWNLLRKN